MTLELYNFYSRRRFANSHKVVVYCNKFLCCFLFLFFCYFNKMDHVKYEIIHICHDSILPFIFWRKILYKLYQNFINRKLHNIIYLEKHSILLWPESQLIHIIHFIKITPPKEKRMFVLQTLFAYHHSLYYMFSIPHISTSYFL